MAESVVRIRRKTCRGMRPVGLVGALACAVLVCACSSAGGTASSGSIHPVAVSRPIPGVRVGLAPTLDGGSAGWCIAETSTRGLRNGSGVVCTGARTSTGAIVIVSCSEIETPKVLASTRVVVLTRGDVAFVAVAGGGPIPTEASATLPGGLRAAAIELPGYRMVHKSFTVGYPWLPCPHVTALGADYEPIHEQGRPGIRLAVPLPRRNWYPPAGSRSDICRLGSTRLPRETMAIEGTVATRVEPLPELLGQAFISCADTTYFYRNEHDLPAAVLLDAAHPGATPSGLLGMKPLAGHPSVFEAPPGMFARRIRGGWLVVEEEDNIGPRVPLELLEDLNAAVRL